MGQKIRSHHAALHHSFQSASQYTGGSMQLVRGACHGLLAPTRNTHARTWLLKRKQERAGMKEMPLFFHLCNAKGLPQVLQSNSARSSDTWVCCKHDALRSHEYKSDCLHTSTMFWDHLLQPQPEHSVEQLKIHLLGLLERAGSTKLALGTFGIWNILFSPHAHLEHRSCSPHHGQKNWVLFNCPVPWNLHFAETAFIPLNQE